MGAANIDTIADYNFAQGDKIDVSALLDSVFGSGALESNYIHLTSSLTNPADLVLQVDTGGTGDFTGGTHDVATLIGINTVGADPVRGLLCRSRFLADGLIILAGPRGRTGTDTLRGGTRNQVLRGRVGRPGPDFHPVQLLRNQPPRVRL